MNATMHGKRIQRIYFGDDSCAQETDTVTFELSVTYHGDHDEIWVVEKHNGVERRHINPRFLQTIVWKGAA